MKREKVFLSLVLFVFSLCFLPGQVLSAADKIDFKTYKEGVKLVKSDKKKAFIYFHADWCKYCDKIKKESFTNDKVIDYLNENFISIMVDTDAEVKLAIKFNAQRLPMLYFLKEDASVLTYHLGYVEAKELLYMLKFINTESYKTMNFSDFVNKNPGE